MDAESANASRENVKLYAEYDKREEACENLIRQQKLSYEHLIKIKIAREVLAATTNMHEQSSEALYKRKEEHHRFVELLIVKPKYVILLIVYTSVDE
jgi:ribosomal protein S7